MKRAAKTGKLDADARCGLQRKVQGVAAAQLYKVVCLACMNPDMQTQTAYAAAKWWIMPSDLTRLMHTCVPRATCGGQALANRWLQLLAGDAGRARAASSRC